MRWHCIILLQLKPCENHYISICLSLNSWFSAELWEQTKLSGPEMRSGCKTKKNRAVATATGRQRFTVFSNIVVGSNNASSVSGNTMAELKPTVLRGGANVRGDGWDSKLLFFFPSALRFFSDWNAGWERSGGEGEEKKGCLEIQPQKNRKI